jgi:hypothetical protein
MSAGPDVYLTDEVFLYRVVGLSARGEGYVVELEDCHFLDVVRVQVTELRERRLRVVTPTPIDGRVPSIANVRRPVETVSASS